LSFIQNKKKITNIPKNVLYKYEKKIGDIYNKISTLFEKSRIVTKNPEEAIESLNLLGDNNSSFRNDLQNNSFIRF
jgi:hypothetical protein